ELKEKPVIILTSNYSREEIIASSKKPLDYELIEKPVTESLIYNALARSFYDFNQDEPDAQKIEVDYKRENISSRVENIKILLAEDNEINQELAHDILTGAGYEVDVVSNGKDAVAKSRENHYDLILMDLQMPLMDGIEAAEKIRSFNAPANEIPILAMTANAMEKDKEECLQAGMNDHISKPIDPEQLLQVLQKWTGQTKFHAKDFGVKEKSSSQKRSMAHEQKNHLHNGNDHDFPEIFGIDIEDGLRIVMGDEKKYRRLLRKFRDGYADMTDQIRKYLSEKDFSSAERLAHTLKGLSGNIGAVFLQKSSEELEHYLKHLIQKKHLSNSSGESEMDLLYRKIERCEKDLKSVVDSLADITEPEESSASEISGMNFEETEKLWAKLIGEIREYDPRAMDTFSSVQNGSGDFASDWQMLALASFLEQYEFDEALEQAEMIYERMMNSRKVTT
ncbi:MAG: response regulator, partial [Spirochaetia bacterium]|nr:response regulator [Spirochaetia bacterium]